MATIPAFLDRAKVVEEYFQLESESKTLPTPLEPREERNRQLNLWQLLHHILKRGHLNEREASMVTRQIAEALQFMHRKGLAHRDLKPENILCQSDTELLPIKLCDFDLASAIRHAGISTMTTPALSTPVGSAEFMAPEVVDAWVVERDKGDFVNYDKRCDLWSLGVIIYIMLCGYPPFYGHCEESKCGWEDGGYCRECQQLLFNRIRDGEFSFPSPEWDCISDDAKDLIGHLLVCDSRLRYSADQVLLHRWIKYPAPETALTTAKVLLRDNSVRNLETFTNEALSISKLIDVQLATNNHQKNLTEMSDNRGDITRCRFVISNNEYLDNNIANKNCSKVVIPKGFACLSRTQQPSHQLCRSSCISNKPLIESPVNGTKYARCNGSNTVDSDILSVNCSRHAVSKENENSIVSDANTEDYNWNCMESVLVECMKSILLDKQNKKYLKRQHQLSKGDCHRRNQLCYSSSIAFSSSRSSCGFEYMKELHRNTTTADDQPFGNRNQIALYHSAKQPPYDSRSDQLIFNQDHRRLS
ncbi:hypothetical protein GJ496_003368 [Pomphorhynchus laevis]|nr:hypothetical protein GJ496_003368 [Pomphorhynchus laevis]